MVTWSYRVGLESKSAKGYNDEIIAIAHNYWHAFQIAHIDAVDNCFENICDFNREKLNELMGPVSFVGELQYLWSGFMAKNYKKRKYSQM